MGYQFASPRVPGDTLLVFTVGETEYSIETEVQFCEAIILFDRNEVCVFQSEIKSVCYFVGRLFSLEGNRLYEIPFPDLGQNYSHVHCYYSWSSLSKDVIKIIFHTYSISYGDFWADFDVLARKYVALGPSR